MRSSSLRFINGEVAFSHVCSERESLKTVLRFAVREGRNRWKLEGYTEVNGGNDRKSEVNRVVQRKLFYEAR